MNQYITITETVLFNGSTFIWYNSPSSQFCIICNLWLGMISFSQMLADYSCLRSCLLHVWIQFVGLVAPSASPEMRWGWESCSSPDICSCPSWRQQWHFLSCSPQEPHTIATIFQAWQRVASKWHQRPATGFVGATHEIMCVRFF